MLRRSVPFLLATLPAALAAAMALSDGVGQAAVAITVALLVILGVPAVRMVLVRPQALPFLLTAPAALSAYPALAVPATTGLLAVICVARRRAISPRDSIGSMLAAAGLLLPLSVGMAQGASWTYVVGDALQFATFFLAVLVARTRDIRLLSGPSLWGLWFATMAVTTANALGRVDFLAAAGSDLQRNINFLAPVLLIWALTDLLWNGISRTALWWSSTAALLILLGFTRGIWAGAAAGVLGVLALYILSRTAGPHRGRRLAAIALLGSVAVAALPAAAPEIATIAMEKVATMVKLGTDYTYQQRDIESDAALEQIRHPLVGEGWGATYVMPATAADTWAGGNVEAGTTHYVHNQYVAQLLRTGWLGCALALFGLLLLLRVRLGQPGSAAAVGTLAYVLVTGWTSPALFTYPTNVLAGLAIGAAPFADSYWRQHRGKKLRRPPVGQPGGPTAVDVLAVDHGRARWTDEAPATVVIPRVGARGASPAEVDTPPCVAGPVGTPTRVAAR